MYRRWKIFYADGTTFDDRDGDPIEAPAWGVLIIACEDEIVGRILERGGDYYVFRGGRWFASEMTGLIAHLSTGIGIVKFGGYVENSLWESIWNESVVDSYLPPMSGKRFK